MRKQMLGHTEEPTGLSMQPTMSSSLYPTDRPRTKTSVFCSGFTSYQSDPPTAFTPR